MSMRIHRLMAENVLRLVAVDITPESDVVPITGLNGSGKTSLLNAIWLALANKAAAKDIKEPIRDGETEGHVTLDLGEIVVTRTWKEGKSSTLTVMSKDGAQYRRPQEFLDERLGALSFDPLAFSNMVEKDQLSTLLSLVELPFDPAELANKRRGIFDRRTEIGREVTRLKGSLDGHERPTEIPAEVSIADLTAEYRDASAAAKVRQSWSAAVDRDNAVVEQRRAELVRAKEALANAEQVAYQTAASLDAIPYPPDLEEIAERLETAESTNASARAAREDADRWKAYDEAVQQQEDFTRQLEAIDQRKAEGLAAAKMPVEGLSFDDDGVLYRAAPEKPYVPFKQCSAAERLRVGMGIAMAANPEIRVLRIQDGSLLDGENRSLIAEMCRDHDFQAFLELVGESGDIGFEISEGQVVGAEQSGAE